MDKISQLKSEVFAKQKTLANIYSCHGSKSLFDYISGWETPKASKQSAALANSAQELLLQTYPAELAASVSEQLLAQPIVSTIDHHGILNHPFFINSNLIFSLKQEAQYLICLSTSGVSLNNSSWPGSILLTTSNGRLKRFSFFSDKIKSQSVFSAPALGPENIEKVLKQVLDDSEILPSQKAMLEELLKKNIVDYNLKDFSSQACAITSQLWSQIFPSAPNVIYLPVEDLVSRLIVKEIASDSGHILHKLFFSNAGWELIEKYFTGQQGAFTSHDKGSFLFWAVDASGRRLHLYRDGDDIQGREIKLGLSADPISSALELKQIYPTSLVCFLVLLYYGITCVGGFNQVNWLTGIKEKFLKLLEEMGDVATAGRIKNIATQNFAEGNLAFLPSAEGLIKATGIDLYLTGRDYYPAYQKLAKALTVGESIESLLPEIYRVITPAAGRDSELLAINDVEIIEQNGVVAKINSSLIR